MSWVTRVGLWAWSFVGFVVAMVIVVAALGAVNEIVLPMTFAAVLAVIFKPAGRESPTTRAQAQPRRRPGRARPARR